MLGKGSERRGSIPTWPCSGSQTLTRWALILPPSGRGPQFIPENSHIMLPGVRPESSGSLQRLYLFLLCGEAGLNTHTPQQDPKSHAPSHLQTESTLKILVCPRPSALTAETQAQDPGTEARSVPSLYCHPQSSSPLPKPDPT